MNDHRSPDSLERKATRSPHFTTISAPSPYEGVGRALAAAFPAAKEAELPDDMLSLLELLNSRDTLKERPENHSRAD